MNLFYRPRFFNQTRIDYSGLSAVQRNIYDLILDAYFLLNCVLPADAVFISKCDGLEGFSAEQIAEVIRLVPALEIVKRMLFHAHTKKEYDRVVRQINAGKKGGIASGKARKKAGKRKAGNLASVSEITKKPPAGGHE